MQVTMFATPIGSLLLMLAIGFVVGVAITVLLYGTQRLNPSDPANTPGTQRDPNNPYEPSNVGHGAPSRATGRAIAFAFLLVAAITVIVFAGSLFFAATSVVKSVPAPMPPPTVVQPQPAQPQSE